MNRRGLTLLELLIVLVILVALAGLVVPTFSWVGRQSQFVATQESLQRLQELLVNRYIPDMGGNGYIDTTDSGGTNPYAGSYLGNMVANLPSAGAVGYPTRGYHPQLRYLFVNPDSSGSSETMLWTNGATLLTPRHWQGPYVQNTSAVYKVGSGTTTPPGPIQPGIVSGTFSTVYGQDLDPTVTDAWGNPIVIQVPTGTDPTTGEPGVNFARLVSAGPNGVIDTPETTTMPTPAQRVDDAILFLFHADPYATGPKPLAQ